MTKRQELEVLAEAIAKLGPDSYLGPWLASVAGEVESSIRSDFFPSCSIRETNAHCEAIRAEAKAVLDRAHASAKDIIAAGHKTIEQDALDRKRRFNAAVAIAVEELNGTKFYL
jgi:hypothetical protein